jgi:hypothetical protein
MQKHKQTARKFHFSCARSIPGRFLDYADCKQYAYIISVLMIDTGMPKLTARIEFNYLIYLLDPFRSGQLSAEARSTISDPTRRKINKLLVAPRTSAGRFTMVGGR